MIDRPSRRTIRDGTPRWVKVSTTMAVVVILLVVGMLLAGHGPGRHFADSGIPHSQTATDRGASAGGNP